MYVIQSVQLRRDKFTKEGAYRWMREHHYPIHKIDVGPNFFHFRQQDPERLRGGRYRTIGLGDKGNMAIWYHG